MTDFADNVSARFEALARAEVARHRKHLGSLTPQQIAAIEALLISAANEISGRISKLVRDYPQTFSPIS
ncbi:MAG TPA: hypothetical protein VJ124_18440 [Pyrinomonadaceae bacterium]|nr:hypothetical protein [Pyrinomonadaceae bacterium]